MLLQRSAASRQAGGETRSEEDSFRPKEAEGDKLDARDITLSQEIKLRINADMLEETVPLGESGARPWGSVIPELI